MTSRVLAIEELDRIDALLPDGVTIEQLVATYNAVHDDTPLAFLFGGDDPESEYIRGARYVYGHLRGVKP